MINENFKDYKLIPLKEYTKVAKVKWGTDAELSFDGSETSYGVDTGRSNLLVVDCDVKNENGVESFSELYSEKSGEEFPTTFAVETPSGGIHFYYKINEKIKSSIGSFLPGVDIRSYGGYAVGPGSKIKKADGEVLEYKAIDEDSKIEEAPEWLLKELRNNKKVKEDSVVIKDKVHDETFENISNNEEIERVNALTWALDKMSNAPEGERNKTLNHAAYFMGAKRVNETDSRELITVAVSNGVPIEEAEKTFESGYNAGLQQDIVSFNKGVKEFKTKVGISFKDDPMDTEFYSHVSLSYNFWKEYSDSLLYWNEDSSWYEYIELKGAWEQVNEDIIKIYVKDFLEKLVKNIRDNKQSKIPGEIYKMQERLWTRMTIDAVTSVARGDFTRRDKDLFDSNLDLINCKNSAFNLKTKEWVAHSPLNYVTKYIPFYLKLGFKDDTCDKIIESLHPNEKDFLQLMAGQSLTGYQPNEQFVLFLYGRGSNGKSTWLDLLLRTSGNYGKLQSPTVLLPDGGRENYALADFQGLRTVIIEELPDNKQLNSGALKHIVGTQQINARAIYGKNKTFDNMSTVFITCNRLPVVTDTDDGTWRRLAVFGFPYSYKKRKEDVKGEWDRLGDSLVMFHARRKTSTAEAFLAWRVEGAMKWYEDIKQEKAMPSTVLDRVEEWNENNDLFLAWYNETLTKDVTKFIVMKDLFDSFNQWCVKRGHPKVSLRFFTTSFLGHRKFSDDSLQYYTKKRITKDMEISQSLWTNPEGNEPPRIFIDREAFVVGAKFI